MGKKIERFITEYVNEINENNAAVFVGAGLSIPAGYISWKKLLEDAAKELGLDIEEETDLVKLAQYYVNRNSRAELNRLLTKEFEKELAPTKNHELLAKLPITTYWTTNYDNLIEKSLEANGKVVDVKDAINRLSITVGRRNTIVYKMHGDRRNPADTIIIKDDYESYYRKHAPFITALSGDLIAKTFLFLGLSFTDPNLDYILSRTLVDYGKDSSKVHYAIFKEVNSKDYDDTTKFDYEKIRQQLFVEDLEKRYHIKCLLINDYNQITEILESINRRINCRNIFISGSAYEYGSWVDVDAKAFISQLSAKLVRENYNIISGFGLGVGSYVIEGALNEIYMKRKHIDGSELILRPFPQEIDEPQKLWSKYRNDMISYSGITIFLFGNKQENGETVLANGMEEEFNLAKKHKNLIVPIGCTGYMALEIFNRINENLNEYFPKNIEETRILLLELNKETDSNSLIAKIMEFIEFITKE